MITFVLYLSKCIICCDVVSSCLSHGCAACFDVETTNSLFCASCDKETTLLMLNNVPKYLS